MVYVMEKMTDEERSAHVEVMDQQIFNVYAEQVRCGAVWKQGDFVLHVPGQPNKVDVLQRAMTAAGSVQRQITAVI